MNGIKFKSGITIMPQMFKGLKYFEDVSDFKNLKKYLVYSGDVSQNRKAGEVVPCDKFPA